MYGKIQKLRFVAMAVSICMAALTFFTGAWWIRSVYDTLDLARLNDTGRHIQSRLNMVRQVLVADMSAAIPAVISLDLNANTAVAKPQLAKALKNSTYDPFDLVLIYGPDRAYVTGIRSDAAGGAAELPSVSGREILPPDAALFEQAAGERQASGLIMWDGHPFVLGLRPIEVKAKFVGFFVAARRLDTRKLAPTAGMSEQTFDIYGLDKPASLPADVALAKELVIGDTRMHGRLLKRRDGIGYVRFDDVMDKPAFILRFTWGESGNSSEKRMLAWLFLCAMGLGGVLHFLSSAALTWFVRQRHKVAGLAGISDIELRLTMESFPGYAFALNDRHEYVGISRSLTGLFHKEPAELFGKRFGSMANEQGLLPEGIFSDLMNSKEWPAVRTVTLDMSSSQQLHRRFQGTAHILKQRHIVLYFVHPYVETEGVDPSHHHVSDAQALIRNQAA